LPSNMVVLSGYLGRYPKFLETKAGKPMVVFDVRLEEWGRKSPKQNNWFDCKAVGRQAEFIEKLKLAPGDLLVVTGAFASEPRPVEIDGKFKNVRKCHIWATQVDVKRFGKLHEGSQFDDEEPIDLP